MIIMLFLISGGSIWFLNGLYTRKKTEAIIPPDIRSTLNFPTFYPVFSENLKVSSESMQYSNDILFYTVEKNEVKIFFSQQAKSDNFSLDKYSKNVGLSNVSEINTPIGRALKGNVLGNKTLIIESEKTIITINAPENINTTDIVSQLTRYNP